MLLPQMLRALLPSAKISFFLHVPFPSSEIYRILPNREEILEGNACTLLFNYCITGDSNPVTAAAKQ
jgi:trehalose-6-phosphate synthase